MDKDLKRRIEIEATTTDEMWAIGTRIHEQLRGNKDYIDSHIVLNCDETDNTVRLFIDKEVKEIPKISI